MARIVCIGEAMVELSEGEGKTVLRYGGDTLNTAVHLARAGHDVAYFTALGEDEASLSLRKAWEGEGIDCSLVLTHPTREVGVYAISTGPEGERRFSYWRDKSAARKMFALPETALACEKAVQCDLLFFSLVSLAILPPEGCDMLLGLARRLREKGGHVAFDGNYRPVLWSGAAEAIAARDAAAALSDIGLPTWEDEMAMSGPSTPADVAGRWHTLGCKEVVVKMGGQGCLLPDGTVLAPPERLSPLDTSGAGDAFDAGYLSARLRGDEPRRAAETGHRLAAWTITRRGAIPPRDADYPVAGG